MGILRLSLRLLAIATTTTLAVLLIEGSRLLGRSTYQRACKTIFRRWSKTFSRILGVQTYVTGSPPKGSFYLICNHLSYIDIPILAAHTDATFVARADLSTWPLIGRVARSVSTIFIDRSRKRDLVQVIAEIRSRKADGLAVIVFPEGTSSKGQEILPFKPSLLELPAQQEQPVYFATISYRAPEGYPAASESICWWDDTPFALHLVRLLRLPGFEARLTFGSEPLIDTDRKVLAEKLWRKTNQIFLPCE